MREEHHRRRLLLIAPAVAALLAGAAGAQSGATPPATQAAAATQPTPAPRRALPLLREGSHVVRVVGQLHYEGDAREWVFTIDDRDRQSPGHELVMLPNALLAEMERMVAAATGNRLLFEVTGEVTVFQGRNYLLLTHPPLLVGHERPRSSAADTSPRSEPGAAHDDGVTDIIRDLEHAAGPIARRARAAPAASSDALMREGLTLVDRRGRVRRVGGGAYQFVFDADAEGLSDPPVIIMPCLLLQRLAGFTEQTGEPTPLLISGQVSVYGDQNYLRPTVYRVARQRTLIAP